MTVTLMRWTLGVALVVVVLLALPWFPRKIAESSEAYADKRVDKLLDINSASQEQLKTLPKVGKALAARIIKHRPYKRKEELVQKRIIPQSTYDKIKDQIVVRQN